jgi:hypothetical protein
VLIFVLDYGLLFWAEQRVPSGISAVMMATIPVLMALAEIIFLGTQRLTLRPSSELSQSVGSFLHSLRRIRCFKLLPCAVADVEYPHRLSPFIDFIDDTINVRFVTVKHVPQLSLCLSGFRGNRATIGIRCERSHGSLQPVVPASGDL